MSDEPESKPEIEDKVYVIEDEKPLESYPYVETDDQKLRCFIVETMASGEIDGPQMVKNLQSVFEWIKSTEKPEKPRKPKLEVVKSE